jgi:DNA polymerase III epsilon subunit-like protein
MRKHKTYNKICILDTETTGVYWNADAPIQIAALICNNQGEIIDSFEEKIKTTHKIAEDASKVHGIYEEDLVNCRRESEVLEDFCVWMKQNDVDVVLTYNGEAFDRRMLNCRCEKLNIRYDFFNKEKFPGIDGYYDCVIHAKRANMWGLKDKLGRKWKLTLVADALGFSTENAHDALADVIMLKNIWFMVDPVVNPGNWEDDAVKTTSLF